MSERKAKTCGRRAVERAAAMCTFGGLLTRVLGFILPQHVDMSLAYIIYTRLTKGAADCAH